GKGAAPARLGAEGAFQGAGQNHGRIRPRDREARGADCEATETVKRPLRHTMHETGGRGIRRVRSVHARLGPVTDWPYSNMRPPTAYDARIQSVISLG